MRTFFINGTPVTALLDTGSQLPHISHDSCKGNGIQIYPINQIITLDGTSRDTIDFLGYIETKFHFLLEINVGNQMLICSFFLHQSTQREFLYL